MKYGNLIYNKIKSCILWEFSNIDESFKNILVLFLLGVCVCVCIINCYFACVYRIRCHFCIYKHA